MSFSENLKRARQRTGMTQQQIASSLGITKSTYCGYETGKRHPDIPKLRRLALLLCTSADELLGLTSGEPACTVSSYEYEQVIHFRQLDPYSQRLIRLIFDTEKHRPAALPQKAASCSGESAPMPLRIALEPVGCGHGAYLGPDGFRTAYVRRKALPADTHFGLPVGGAGLEPRFHSGDVLMIALDKPRPGQVGVFLLNGLGFVREMGCNELLSINPSKPPLPMDSSIRPCGTVIGSLSPLDIL